MSKVNWLLVVVTIGGVVTIGCSQENRDELVERGENALRALNGGSSTGEATPRIVKEQQRKERVRQNNTWTPENRAHHPIEYCQAQLEDLQRYGRELEARAHEKACAIAAVRRELGDDDTISQNLKKFITEAKKTYKKCDATNRWPAQLGGYSLSKEKTRDKIIEAAQKLSGIEAKITGKKNQLVSLEKTLKITQDEQTRIAKIREQVQNTINDLRIKKVIEGDNSIVASLNAIEDAMGVLGVDYDDPRIESIIQADDMADREKLFKKIMDK